MTTGTDRVGAGGVDPPALAFPPGLDRGTFLAGYWQKKPLLLRDAFPGFSAPIDANELAGLSCEYDVESRLVLSPAPDRYTLETGPFDEAQLSALAPRDWTLLIQDVDKHLPALTAILDRFDFVPDWRIDDLMVSVAAPGGSVGPHVDAYDVFLLQADGERDWFVGVHGSARTRPGNGLSLVEPFEPVWSARLRPGDVLYLPPGVPHHGVAVGRSMTCSIGFHAPSVTDMLVDLAGWRAERVDPDARYADADLSIDEAQPRGWIAPATIRRVRAALADALTFDDGELARWFGAFVTETKPWLDAVSDEPCPDPNRALTGAVRLVRNPVLRWAWTDDGDRTILFVGGEALEQPTSLRWLVRRLCDRQALSTDTVARALADPLGRALLDRLVASDKLQLDS